MAKIKTDNSDVPCLSINDVKDVIPVHAGHVSVSWLLNKLELIVAKKLKEKNDGDSIK